LVRVATRSKLTPEEYLAWERLQPEKHEYHSGDALAPAVGSPRHNWLAGNVQAALKCELDDRCFTFTSAQRIVLDAGKRYVYPDASVVCGPVTLVDGATDVVANPSILVEIQQEVRIEHYRRAPDRGWFYRSYGAGECIVLANGTQLDVDAIYARAFELPGD
jgi:Uma2 family endonuclease